MTTIAYRDGVMASDSCWSYNDSVSTLQTKMVRCSSGGILGSAGGMDSRTLEVLLDKVKTPAQMPSYEALGAIRQDYLGLLVLPKGRIFKICCTGVDPSNWDGTNDAEYGMWEISKAFMAIGSGAAIALGHMTGTNRTAYQAVHAACAWDIYSKPPVHTASLIRTKPPAKGAKS